MDGRTMKPMTRAAEALSSALSNPNAYTNKSFDEEHVRIAFTDFAKLMRSQSICYDARSIKAKWDILLAQGVLTNYGTKDYDRAFFSIPTFNEVYSEYGVPEICTHTFISESKTRTDSPNDAHTHFSEVSQ